MSARGLDFLQNRIETNVTDALKESVDGDSALLTLELAKRAIAGAARSGLRLGDLEPEFGIPETIIREVLESSEGTPGD